MKWEWIKLLNGVEQLRRLIKSLLRKSKKWLSKEQNKITYLNRMINDGN